eukprot:9786516-Alexandrium_andersonii.AAC.1
MSASLVGSEMCIRDSRGLRGTSGQGAEGSSVVRGPGRSLGRERRAAFPVSYTHLTLPTICSV